MTALIVAALVVLGAIVLMPAGVLAWHLAVPERGQHAAGSDWPPGPPFALPGPRASDPSTAERIASMPSPWPDRPVDLHHELPDPQFGAWPVEGGPVLWYRPARPFEDWLRDSVVMQVIKES